MKKITLLEIKNIMEQTELKINKTILSEYIIADFFVNKIERASRNYFKEKGISNKNLLDYLLITYKQKFFNDVFSKYIGKSLINIKNIDKRKEKFLKVLEIINEMIKNKILIFYPSEVIFYFKIIKNHKDRNINKIIQELEAIKNNKTIIKIAETLDKIVEQLKIKKININKKFYVYFNEKNFPQDVEKIINKAMLDEEGYSYFILLKNIFDKNKNNRKKRIKARFRNIYENILWTKRAYPVIDYQIEILKKNKNEKEKWYAKSEEWEYVILGGFSVIDISHSDRIDAYLKHLEGLLNFIKKYL